MSDLANTMLRVFIYARIPLFLHRKSNHIFTVWQHMVLLVIRQYEGKSYRMFSEWLVEAYYLRTVLQLSHIPHFTTLHKFTERISGTLLEKINFIIHNSYKNETSIRWNRFVWAKATHFSQYYTERTKLRRRKYINHH